MTNYDQVLDDIRDEQGYITGRQEKQAAVGAAEQVLEQYRDEQSELSEIVKIKGIFLEILCKKLELEQLQL